MYKETKVRVDKRMKRLIDILISLFALIILSPIFLLVTYKVRKNLGSPIFYLQELPGKDVKLFKMIKFRYMKDAFDKQGNSLPDDQRITPFGHKLRATTLDEMPQLINVLKGDMSIVGPRPQMKDFLEHYTAEQMRRHEVKPGMTGLAQVSGRNNLSWEEKFIFLIVAMEAILGILMIVILIFLQMTVLYRLNQSN